MGWDAQRVEIWPPDVRHQERSSGLADSALVVWSGRKPGNGIASSASCALLKIQAVVILKFAQPAKVRAMTRLPFPGKSREWQDPLFFWKSRCFSPATWQGRRRFQSVGSVKLQRPGTASPADIAVRYPNPDRILDSRNSGW